MIKKIEHAEFGAKVLFEGNMIREFIEDSNYDNIIRKAIYNHNKFEIEDNIDDIELLHCKIIRDADKLDNFRVKQKDKLEDMFPKIYNSETINYENISTKVYDDFMKHRCIKLEDRKTIIDYWVCVIAFIFDLNFNISLKYVKENNYIDILIDRIDYKNNDTKKKMEDIRICAKEYIENRCNEDIKLVQILWDYMKMNQQLKHSDCIIGLGSKDINVANVASELYLNGYANKLIFSGGLGKITYKLWNETEAEKFAKIAINKGIPSENIYLEKESTNTGDNFRFSKKLIENEKLNIKSCIVVCKPYDEKRAYAAFKKIMPEYEVIIHSENISCEEYYKRNGNEWIDVLVGDIQRMQLFYENGWQIKMNIPNEVWEAYEILVKRGYDRFVLKNKQDEGDKKNIEIELNKIL